MVREPVASAGGEKYQRIAKEKREKKRKFQFDFKLLTQRILEKHISE